MTEKNNLDILLNNRVRMFSRNVELSVRQLQFELYFEAQFCLHMYSFKVVPMFAKILLLFAI